MDDKGGVVTGGETGTWRWSKHKTCHRPRSGLVDSDPARELLLFPVFKGSIDQWGQVMWSRLTELGAMSFTPKCSVNTKFLLTCYCYYTSPFLWRTAVQAQMMWEETSGKQLLCKLEISSMSLGSDIWIGRSNLSPDHTNKDGVLMIVCRNSWGGKAGKHLWFKNKYDVYVFSLSFKKNISLFWQLNT